MSIQPTHVPGFDCPETVEHAARHADTSPAGIDEAGKRDELVRRFPTHPNAGHVGAHRTPEPTPLYDRAAWASGFAPLPEVTA